MNPNTSFPSSDDADEFTLEHLRRAKLRIGLKEVSREEWQATVQEKTVKKQRVNIELDLRLDLSERYVNPCKR